MSIKKILKGKVVPTVNCESEISNIEEAIAFHQDGQLEKAAAIYRKILKQEPKNSDALNMLGVIAHQTGLHALAHDIIGIAIAINPKIASYHNNRGLVYEALKRFDESIMSFDKAIELQPDLAEAYFNRGIVQKQLKQFKPAVVSYNKAIFLKLNYAEAYWNKSILLLLMGEILEGFNLYEWRWEQKDNTQYKRYFPQPLWTGDIPLFNKKILIHCEQGLGDTIQFCRYIKMVSKLGAKVIFEVQKPLVPLLKNFEGVSILMGKDDPLPDFDYHCPLLSLPKVFKTDLNSIPFESNYLMAEPQRVMQWADKFKDNKFKIGIGWQGSQGTRVDIGRSFELSNFKGIAELPNVHLISLQKGYGSEQLKFMPNGMEVTDLGIELDSDGAFLDTAAVMMSVNLVITSDTALAHLAGALGIRTWLILKYVPDWRWMLDRSDCPWYPSIKIYRQEVADDWRSVFEKVQADLTKIL